MCDKRLTLRLEDKHPTKRIARAKAPRDRNKLASSEKRYEAEVVGTPWDCCRERGQGGTGARSAKGSSRLQGPEASTVLWFASEAIFSLPLPRLISLPWSVACFGDEDSHQPSWL